MYIVMMKDGSTINVNATGTELWQESRTLKLYCGIADVGVFNLDNIVGWVNANYVVESEEQKNEDS